MTASTLENAPVRLHQPIVMTASKLSKLPVHWFLIGIIALSLCNYTYLMLRSGVSLSDQDTYALTITAVAAEKAQSILESPQPYTHGMNYTALLLMMSKLSGLSYETLQLIVLPLVIAVVLPVVAFVAYRELARSTLIGLLATLMLFLQPDFLWVTWRGSHEKITWAVVLTLFFILARTFRFRGQLRALFIHIIVFYMLVLGLINTNMFFSSSFITMVAITFAAGRLLIAIMQRSAERRAAELGAVSRPLIDLHLRRLIYVVSICLLLVYMTLFYLYPPARNSLLGFTETFDRVSSLVLNVEPVADAAEPVVTNPYSYVSTTWLSPFIFLALTLFNWSVLGFAALVWLVTMWHFWRRKLDMQQNDGLLLMCLAFAAFSAQVLVSAIADLSGSHGANTQVRLFTPVMIFAIPLTAYGITGIWQITQRRFPRVLRTALMVVAVVAVAYFEFAAVSKAVNEPFLSNRWSFTAQPERATAEWLRTYAPGGTLWSGIDERYASDLNTLSNLRADRYMDIYYGGGLNTDYTVWSDIERARWLRTGQFMPNIHLDSRNLIYDNGMSQVYRRPAVTIYQD